MNKYLKVFSVLFKNNLSKAMEYRGSFVIALVVTVLQVGIQLWLVSIFFDYTDAILSWTKGEIFLMVGLFRMVKGLFDLFFRRNLFSFPDLINSGEFDNVLTKPISSLFTVSCKEQVMTELSGPISGIFIFIYSLKMLNFDLSLLSILLIVSITILSLVAFYSFFAIFSTLAIYLHRFTAINEFQDVVSQTVRFPIEVISRGNKTLEIITLPLILLFTYPAKIILQKVPVYGIFIEMFLVFGMFFVLVKFWKFSLRYYSSASS